MSSPSGRSLSLHEKPVPGPQAPLQVEGLPDHTKETPNVPPLQHFTPEFKPGKSFMLAFASICIITLAAAIDATSLSIAIPIITVKLHGTAIEAFWSGTSFLVTSAVFQPVIAGLSHVFGRKQVCDPLDSEVAGILMYP